MMMISLKSGKYSRETLWLIQVGLLWSKNKYSKIVSQDHAVENLDKISDRLKDILGVKAAVYGILLTFIVTSELNHIFFSWTLIIWIAFILAILVRSVRYLRILSDVVQAEGHHL
jgi:hypothetical protein